MKFHSSVCTPMALSTAFYGLPSPHPRGTPDAPGRGCGEGGLCRPYDMMINFSSFSANCCSCLGFVLFVPFVLWVLG